MISGTSSTSETSERCGRGRTQSGDSEKAQSCRKQATTIDGMMNLQETELLTTQARPNNTKHPLHPPSPPSHYYRCPPLSRRRPRRPRKCETGKELSRKGK